MLVIQLALEGKPILMEETLVEYFKCISLRRWSNFVKLILMMKTLGKYMKKCWRIQKNFINMYYILFVDNAVVGRLQELSWFKMLTFFKQSLELQWFLSSLLLGCVDICLQFLVAEPLVYTHVMADHIVCCFVVGSSILCGVNCFGSIEWCCYQEVFGGIVSSL